MGPPQARGWLLAAQPQNQAPATAPPALTQPWPWLWDPKRLRGFPGTASSPVFWSWGWRRHGGRRRPGGWRGGKNGRGVRIIWGGSVGPPSISGWGAAAESYVGSTERMREAGLVSANRSRFTGWILAWGEARRGPSAQPRVGGIGEGVVPEPPPHPAAHDVPEHGGRRVRLHGVLAGVGERHAVASVQEGGPGGAGGFKGRLGVPGQEGQGT